MLIKVYMHVKFERVIRWMDRHRHFIDRSCFAIRPKSVKILNNLNHSIFKISKCITCIQQFRATSLNESPHSKIQLTRQIFKCDLDLWYLSLESNKCHLLCITSYYSNVDHPCPTFWTAVCIQAREIAKTNRQIDRQMNWVYKNCYSCIQ